MAINSIKNNKGFTIIEIATVILVIGVGIFSLVNLGAFVYRSVAESKQYEKASLMAQEAMEAARNFRDASDWGTDGLGSLDTSLVYHPVRVATATGSSWQLAAGPERVRGFDRRVLVQKVSRDPATAGPEVVYDPANNDPDTRKVEVRVEWQGNSVVLSQYLTNWQP